MEECTVWPASTQLRNLLPVYLLLTPPLVGGAPLSTLLLRAKTQQASVSTLFPSPYPIYQSPRPLPLSLTHLLLFLSPHCHSPCSDHPPSQPGKLQQPPHSYPYLPPCSFPLRSPPPASLLWEPMISSNDLHWGLGVGDNDLQKILWSFSE